MPDPADAAGAVAGYLVAYPWRLDDAPALNGRLDALPGGANVLYLHDLALTRAARGAGHAARGAHLAIGMAQDAGLDRIALIAVNEAASFWTRQGFEARHSPAMTAKLVGYGAGALYMIRSA